MWDPLFVGIVQLSEKYLLPVGSRQRRERFLTATCSFWRDHVDEYTIVAKLWENTDVP